MKVQMKYVEEIWAFFFSWYYSFTDWDLTWVTFEFTMQSLANRQVTGKSGWNHCLVGQTHMSCPEIEYQQQSPENFESPFHFSLCRWSSALIRNKLKGWRVAQLGERNLRQLVICWGFQAWRPLQSWEVLVTFKDQSQYGTEGQLQQLAFV